MHIGILDLRCAASVQKHTFRCAINVPTFCELWSIEHLHYAECRGL